MTGKKAAKDSLSRRLRHLGVMDDITRVSLASDTVDALLGGVLTEVLAAFGADRVWFLHPCDPTAPAWSLPMERARPGWADALPPGVAVAMNAEVAEVLAAILASPEPVQFGPFSANPVPSGLADSSAVKSGLAMVIRPRLGSPWCLGLQHYVGAHFYPDDEVRLLEAIAQRVSDALSSLLLLRQIQESESRLRLVLDEALDAVISADQAGRVVGWNKEAERMFGYSRDEVLGREFIDLVLPPSPRESQRLEMTRFLQTGAPSMPGRRVEIAGMHADGREIPIELTLAAVKQDESYLYCAFIRDVTERRRAEAEIHTLAFFDPLTGMPNRRLLRERLQQATAAGGGTRGAVLYVDLDDFKTLNDSRGHEVGDLLLIEMARRLQGCVGLGDTVARLGSDEFVLVLEHLTGTETDAVGVAEQTAEKILTAVTTPCELRGQEYHCSCSIGICLFGGESAVTLDVLLGRADQAMYRAKQSGRNSVRFFDPAMQVALEKRMMLEGDLRHAIQREQFLLHYQMQVGEGGRVFGAEALVRWVHPERGLVSPLDFIPLAEETGLILPIGKWVLETACAQLKSWEGAAQTRDLQLAVNVSARQFRQPDFCELVRDAIRRHRIDPTRLKLELTESLVLHNVRDTITKMEEIKAAGVHFSMDDFGTGHSSLAYLTQLPFDQIKIDQSFVRNIFSKSTNAVIVQTIIGMAANLGMEVIAEGVETLDQLEFLRRHGCGSWQGYLFSRPVPIMAFEQRMVDVLANEALC